MMDRDLIRQSLSNHSENLLSLLTREQSENPDFKHVAADLPQTFNQSENEEETSVLEHFIARKADLLFLPSWKTSTPANECQETGEAYAVMPVLEQFMELSYDERRELFYRDVERGDVVVGRVSSLRDFGIFVTLVCCACGLERDVEDLEIKALCPIRDVPSTGNHDDPLSYYQVGDFIRAGVKDIDRYYEKLTLSLYSSTLAPHLHDVKLGVISKEDLPLHYTRGERLAAESRETYDKLLHSSLGLANPLNVGYLLGKLGMDEKHTPSLMRGLQRTRFKEDDFAPALRKKQSVSWALKCVKTGVDHFKRGRHVEAMNAYNKALEIDTNNVEALVARGALYATKGSLVKAMGDFELALETCPSHRNAKKYLCQTLLERGGQLEEEEKLVTAESLYKRAMTLDDTLREADEALKKLQERMRKTLELKEQEAARHQEKAPPTETSAEKLRKILKEEKRMKRKRRHSTSSSSSTTSDSTSSPAKSVKKSRKRKHKKKHKRRRASSDSKDEMFLAPANTSASFLQQRQTITKLLHDDDDDDDDDDDEEEQWCEKVARGRSEDTPFKPRLDDLDRNGDGAEQRWEGPKPRRDSSSSVQSEASHTSHKQRFSGPGESRPGRSERPDGGEERAGRGSDTSVVTDLRKANLIDIFSQIAEFQKAKKQKT